MERTKIFLPCSGLGRIRRGYESFTQECFEALLDEPRLDLHLFKGGGSLGGNETVLWSLPRASAPARWLGRLLRRDAYFVEQLTFFLGLRRHLAAGQPDVVYFSDGNLGNLLWRWRRKHGQRYRLILSNGGPLSPPFPRWDMVQQVSAVYYDDAKRAGQPDDRQVLLPYGFAIPKKLAVVEPTANAALRARLGLPTDRPVLLSVGAVNASHKRMDYLVRELAALPAPRPYLLMLGQSEDETASILALAEQSLGHGNFAIRSVRLEEMEQYYQASDLFTLASLQEGFGRVFIEALAHGLPCLAHDYAVAREVLAEKGFYGNFREPGALAGLVLNALALGSAEAARHARHRRAYERFSWDMLGGQYVAMLRQCAAMEPNTCAGGYVHGQPAP